MNDNVLSIVYLFIVLVVSLIGNMLIVIATIKNRRLRSFTSQLICNLAVSDLLITCVNLPVRMSGFFDVDWTTNGISQCKISTSLALVVFTSSNANLFLITLDRFFGVIYPLRYRSLATQRKIYIAIFTVWLYAILVGVFPFVIAGNHDLQPSQNQKIEVCTFGTVISSEYLLFVEFGTFCLPSLIMFGMYVVILERIYSSRHNRINSNSQFPKNTTNNSSSKSNFRRASSKKSSAMRSIARDMKLAKGVCIIVIVYTVLLMPIATIDVINLLNGQPIVPVLVTKISILLAYSNPMVNPPIYAVSARRYRQAFLQILHLNKTTGKVYDFRDKFDKIKKADHNIPMPKIVEKTTGQTLPMYMIKTIDAS